MEKNFNSFLPTLALFAAAAFRILPITNRLIISIQHMKYGEPVLRNLIANLNGEIVNDFLRLDKKIDNTDNEELYSIRLNDLGFKYNFNDEILFENVNLQISKGDKIAILEESGSGKSAFVDLLIGFLKPTSGQILINENALKSIKLSTSIGYVPKMFT